MADGEPGTTPDPEEAGKLPLDQTQAVLIFVAAIIALIVLVNQCSGGSESTDEGGPSTSTTIAASTTSTAVGNDTTAGGFAPLNCAAFLEQDAAAIALETDDPDGRIISTFLFSQGERCHWQDSENEANYVIIEPGTADDFAVDANRLDTTARPVGGIGEIAVWFAGDSAGSLTVAEESEHGTVFLRVEFGRPDIADDRRLFFATELALQTLRRIPGIDWTPEPEPEPTRLPYAPEVGDPAAALASVDLDANVDRLVDDGLATEAEAVTAALRFLLREDPGPDFLPTGGLADPVASQVVDRAAALVAADPAGTTELAELLERLAPSDLPLPPFADGEPAPSADAARSAPRVRSLAQADDPADEDELIEPCPDQDWFGMGCAFFYGPITDGSSLTPDNYYVGAPTLGDLPIGQLDEAFLDEIRQAMTDAALRYEPLGPMPAVLIWMSPEEAEVEVVQRRDETDWCQIYVYTPTAAAAEIEVVRQWIAWEMASCLIRAVMPDRVGEPHEPDEWILPAGMYYLSALVEPDGRIEEPYLETFGVLEFDEPVERRRRANTFLFLFLHDRIGADGVISLMRTAPADGGYEGQAATLSATEGFDRHLHDFTRAVTDKTVPDGAGNPYQHQTVTFRADLAPNMLILEDVETLMAQRWRLFVPAGMTACISFEKTGDTFTGWRPADSTNWEPVPPNELTGESFLVATTTGPPGTFTIDVDDLVESGMPCDDEQGPEALPDPLPLEPCPLDCAPSRLFNDVEIPVLFENNPGLSVVNE